MMLHFFIHMLFVQMLYIGYIFLIIYSSRSFVEYVINMLCKDYFIVYEINPSMLKECPICFDDLIIKDHNVIELYKCHHTFHKECMEGWLTTYNHHSCPICRRSVYII